MLLINGKILLIIHLMVMIVYFMECRDLIILERFLKEIIISLTKKEFIENKCFDFLYEIIL